MVKVKVEHCIPSYYTEVFYCEDDMKNEAVKRYYDALDSLIMGKDDTIYSVKYSDCDKTIVNYKDEVEVVMRNH